MKKLLYIISTAMLALFLAACGNTVTEKQNTYSTGNKSSVLTVFTVNDSQSVYQFNFSKDAIDGMSDEYVYSFIFNKSASGTYTYEDVDQAGEKVSFDAKLNKDGSIIVSTGNMFPDIEGTYFVGGDKQTVDGKTLLNILRTVDSENIGDFGLSNPYDVCESYMAGDWFHLCYLFSEDTYVGSYLVAKDLSSIVRLSGAESELIYGNFDSLTEATVTYNLIDENDNPYEVTENLLTPEIYGGTTMVAGDVEELFIMAPYDLTRSISVESTNTKVVTANGSEITAVAPGTAKLKVEADYCGTILKFETEVTVVEFSEEEGPVETDEYSEYVDSKYTTYFDKESQRATMEICVEEGIISVDILWADDANTTHHWSYVGSDTPNGNLYSLSGRYTIDHDYDDGTFNEEVIAEDILATLTLGDDGYFYWYDASEDTDHGCVFEKPEW